MDVEETRDCDICLSSVPATLISTWDCNQCNWCYECITSGITSSPQKSDWPQNWCGHDVPTPITLRRILAKTRKHIPPQVYTKWYDKSEQWSQVKCPHCTRFTHSDHLEGRVLSCPSCRKSICIECEKPAHEGQCHRTSKEDLKAVMNALRHESAAMCPRCGYITGRMKEGCDRIVCPKPCTQVFCFKCSKDWQKCQGKCKGGGSTEVLAKEIETEAESPGIAKAFLSGLKDTIRKELQFIDQDKLTQEMLAKIGKDCAFCVSTIDQALLDGSASSFSVFSEVQQLVHRFVNTLRKDCEAAYLKDGESDVRTDQALLDEKASRKRAPTGDLLIQKFLKKARTEIIEDEEDKVDLEAGSYDAEDGVIHDDGDDEDDGDEFDVDGEDEYASDNDDEASDELEEDYIEW